MNEWVILLPPPVPLLQIFQITAWYLYWSKCLQGICVTSLILGWHKYSEEYSILISPSLVGSRSLGFSSMFSGVLIVEVIDGAEDKVLGDTTTVRVRTFSEVLRSDSFTDEAFNYKVLRTTFLKCQIITCWINEFYYLLSLSLSLSLSLHTHTHTHTHTYIYIYIRIYTHTHVLINFT